jgi:hypothetical protein
MWKLRDNHVSPSRKSSIRTCSTMGHQKIRPLGRTPTALACPGLRATMTSTLSTGQSSRSTPLKLRGESLALPRMPGVSATRILDYFDEPAFAVLAGITAGLNDQKPTPSSPVLDDILVPTATVDVESGKLTPKGKEPAGQTFRLSPYRQRAVASWSGFNAWADQRKRLVKAPREVSMACSPPIRSSLLRSPGCSPPSSCWPATSRHEEPSKSTP